MPSELAQQQAHDIPQLSLAIPPFAGPAGSTQMGPIILCEIHKSMVHTRRAPTQP